MRRKAPRRSPASTSEAPGPDVTRDAEIVGVFGATGSGKSSYLKALLAARPAGVPCLIFDPGREYNGRAFTSEPDFIRAAVADATGAFAYRLLPAESPALARSQFDRFCTLALRIAKRGAGCFVIADELHDFIDPRRPADGWAVLVKQGRKWGCSVLAASIRPALIDKTFWTCCTRIRSGRLNYENDIATVGNALGELGAELAGLTGTQWLQRDMLTGATARGELAF